MGQHEQNVADERCTLCVWVISKEIGFVVFVEDTDR